MYRVMVIDDEQSARNLLKISVDWNKLDMEVVGEASSGIEAINIIDDVKPDLAFVDISMPFMNGIDFTELATKRYPNLVIIILTALDDFEYARKCIRLPVFEYMLKPIVREDVLETLVRAKTLLDEKAAAKKNSLVFDIDEESDEDSSVDLIKKYINEHFGDSSLNLTGVAQEFGFSSSYLSRKFKQEAGMNFVEYLSSCRMKKAMELAALGKKMFYTAQTVGIPDPNYFGRCFKKHTGQSYSEYVAGLKSEK
ncbi:MAG: response regulator [Lachnospiraceae bacterium]|nr:response regulator [Lachnospiraceae bacterium]